MPEHIPEVAKLFQTVFRDPRKTAPAALEQYLLELFCKPPWYDPELPSRVLILPDGTVGGFIGVIPLNMSFGGQPIRTALASSIMVENPKANPLAGAALLRSFVNGPQDLSISESANP